MKWGAPVWAVKPLPPTRIEQLVPDIAVVTIRVRRGREDLLEIYPEKHLTIDPELVELREFYCPVSGTLLLDVDCVPPTYPVETDFTADLATFYRNWLSKPLPVTL